MTTEPPPYIHNYSVIKWYTHTTLSTSLSSNGEAPQGEEGRAGDTEGELMVSTPELTRVDGVVCSGNVLSRAE